MPSPPAMSSLLYKTKSHLYTHISIKFYTYINRPFFRIPRTYFLLTNKDDITWSDGILSIQVYSSK
jgi:hypothetical protein